MTNEELHRVFLYEPDTGMLRRISGGHNHKPYPWRGAGHKKRYLITGNGLYLHRLVWQYHHGYVPKMIDHIDGDARNNRIENLRECTPAQNQYNSRAKVNNRSGYKGAYPRANCVAKPWYSKIVVDGRKVLLGYFSTPQEAAQAYDVAAKKFAGQFANLNSKD